MQSSPQDKKATKKSDQKSDAKLETKAVAAKSPRTLIYEHLATFATETKTDESVQYCFSNPARAKEFLNWIKVQSLPEINEAKIEEREKKDGDKKEYVIRLSPQQKAEILLPPKEIASVVRFTELEIVEAAKLLQAVLDNDAGWIDRALQKLSPENQLAVFRKLYQDLHMRSLFACITSMIPIREQRNAAFYVLVSHSSSDVINEALILPGDVNDKNWTTLHIVALSEKLDIFQALMDKASTAVIDQGLCIQSTLQGVTPFVCAVSSKRADVFCALVNKASPVALNRTLGLHPTYVEANGDSTFHYVASQQIGFPFITLINKADREVISGLLSRKNNQGNTGLHYAIRYQPSYAVALLIERTTPEALNKTCRMSNKYGNNILEYILSYHPPEVIAALFNKIDDETLEIMLRAPDPPPQLLALIVNYLGHEPSWQTDSLVERFFALAGPVLAKEFCKFWLAGKELPKNIMEKASLYTKDLSPNAAVEYKQIDQAWQQQLKQTEQKEAKLDVSGIKLQSGKFIPIPLDLKDEKALISIAKEIWKEGLASVVDYRFIRQRFPKTTIAQIANELYRAGLLFSGCYAEFREPEPINSKLDQIIAQGNAIHKVVRQDRWPDFFNQITNYKHRPADLRKVVDKKTIKRKHVHLKDETVDYVYHKPGEKENKEKENPEYTKKMSGTLLAEELTTAAFGEYDINQPLVGFVFDRNKSIIKMMAKQDIGSHERGWIGSEDEVEKYAERYKEINVTDYETFREWVNKNPKRLNELLVKLSREGALAITIVTDTEKARELARKYKQALKEKCGLDLPIFFYDRALREMRPYSLWEQRDDSLGFNALRAEHNQILRKRAVYQYFSKEEIDSKYYFSSKEGARAFLGWVTAQSLSDTQNLEIEEIEQKSDGSKKYAVKLLKEQQKELLLPIKFTPKVLTNDERMRLRDSLELLIKNKDIQTLDKRMQGITESDLMEIFCLKGTYDERLLNVSATHSSEAFFIIFLSYCSDLTLSKTFLFKDQFDKTILYCAAKNFSGEAFRILINRVDSTLIDSALSLEEAKYDTKNPTVLEIAASRQPPDVFCALIEKASANVLNQFFIEFRAPSIFRAIAINQKDAPFIALLNKVDNKVISQLLPTVSKISDGKETLLHEIVSHQSKGAVLKLLALATKESLNQACLSLNSKGESVFNYAFSYQPPAVMVALLNSIDDDTLSRMYGTMGAAVIALIKDHLSKESTWPTQPLVARLLKHLNNTQIAKCYCQLWLSGRSLPLEFMKSAKPDFAGLIAAQPAHADEFKEIQATWGKEYKEESKDDLVQIKLHSGSILPISKHEKEFTEIAKTIWENGLESLSDLHTLKKYFSNTVLSPMVDQLHRAGLLFSGCYASFNLPTIPLQIDARLKIESIFLDKDQAANKLWDAHVVEENIRAKKSEIEAGIQAEKDKREVLIKSYIARLNGLGENTSRSESKSWMTKFQEKLIGVAPAITRSAAIKMGHLLAGNSSVLSNDELLALRSGPLGQIVSEIERDGLLSKEFIEQEKRGAVVRRGYGGHR